MCGIYLDIFEVNTLVSVGCFLCEYPCVCWIYLRANADWELLDKYGLREREPVYAN